MATETYTVTFPTGGTGTVTVIDTTANSIDLSLGSLAAFEAGSAANSLQKIADAITGVTDQQSINTGKITSIVDAIGSLESSLTTTNAILSQILATQQIALAETIEKNQFEQQATNAALKRNGLPEVKVETPNVAAQVQKAVSNSTVIAASAAASGAVTTAIAGTASYIANVSGITTAFKTAQGWTQTKIADGLKAVGLDSASKRAEAEALKNKAKNGKPG